MLWLISIESETIQTVKLTFGRCSNQKKHKEKNIEYAQLTLCDSVCVGSQKHLSFSLAHKVQHPK